MIKDVLDKEGSINFEQFEKKEFLNGFGVRKILSSIDNFYINSALISVSGKKEAHFLDISDCKKKMYEDIYYDKIKIPEVIDDNWVSASLSRYMQKDVDYFQNQKSPEVSFENFKDADNLKVIRCVLNCFGASEVKVNFEGLSVFLKLCEIEGVFFKVKVVTCLRAKLESSFLVNGKEIDFYAVTAPARDLQRHEVLSLKVFLTAVLDRDRKIDIVVSKVGDEFAGIFVDDQNQSMVLKFEDFGINWGSFDVNRRV